MAVPDRRVFVDHVAIDVRDLAASRAFYEAALAPLGARVSERREGELDIGPEGCEDLVIREGRAASGPVHIAFAAGGREQVDAFHAAALGAGGRDNGAPGPRPDYHPGYYAAYAIDPDGNNVEAVLHER